jgi:hypothetical protein
VKINLSVRAVTQAAVFLTLLAQLLFGGRCLAQPVELPASAARLDGLRFSGDHTACPPGCDYNPGGETLPANGEAEGEVDQQPSSPAPASAEGEAPQPLPTQDGQHTLHGPPSPEGAAVGATDKDVNGRAGFDWASAIRQSMLFLGVQHGFALATQEKTRRELRGPFFKDYFRSVSKLGGWADGGRFFTNYVSHPMQGAVAGYIQIHNDPRGIRQEFGKSRGYWVSRLKAMAWNAAYSTQFELGPISQSSIGNVGLHTSLDGKERKMSYVDLVVTPTLGTVWLVGEDLLDRQVVRRIEAKFQNRTVRLLARSALNPCRSMANLLRFKLPWHRDTRRLDW